MAYGVRRAARHRRARMTSVARLRVPRRPSNSGAPVWNAAGDRKVAYRPGSLSEVLTEHYRRAHPEAVGLPSLIARALIPGRTPRYERSRPFGSPRPGAGLRDHHLRQRRVAVRLPDAVPHGPDHCGAGRRAGNVRPARRLHRRGTGRVDPRAVPAAQRRRRDAAPVHRQRGTDGERVRRRRCRDGDLRGLALHRGAPRAGRDLGRHRPGQLLAGRARVRGDGPGVPDLPDRGVPGPSRRRRRVQQPLLAALPALEGVLAAGGRADRHDHHPLHAVLPDLGRGRQRGHPEDI